MDRDRDLVEAAQRGDPAAVVDLVHSTGYRLFALGYRILRDVDQPSNSKEPRLGLRASPDIPSWFQRAQGKPGGVRAAQLPAFGPEALELVGSQTVADLLDLHFVVRGHLGE